MLILESNGDAYPCDFFITDELKLGNIGVDNLSDILSNPIYESFLSKKTELPQQCLDCEYLKYCHGGCPRNRVSEENNNYDYFCESYRTLYQYSAKKMKVLTNKIKMDWKKQLIKEGSILPDRNDICYCGSGKKYKKCCALLPV